MAKICKQCGEAFETTQQDLAFLEEISPVFNGKKEVIPPPTLCPDCRTRQRIIWRPELHLHYRKSDKSGAQILSMFPQDAPCTVWSTEEWWSDDWDAMRYGQDMDLARPFFEQFREVFSNTPLPSISVSRAGNVNSDYVNSASYLKNCYLLAGANYNEDCQYGNFVNHCKDCMDCSFVDHCELCHECIDCTKCYDLRYCQQCTNCSNSAFLFGCRNCHDCFGSVNITDKAYVFLNEQLTKEEYEKRLAALELHRRTRVKEADAYFRQHRLRYPHRFMIGEMNENATGNGILRSKNVTNSFDVSELEDCSNCAWLHQAKSCMDCYAWGFTAEECYQCLEVGDHSSRARMSVVVYHGVDLFYCNNCRGCEHCFGCVSLRNAKHCILNKQYTKEEYERVVPQLIAHMRETKEWGEFFPFSVCPISYNESIAQDYFPLDESRARALGARWTNVRLEPGQPTPIPDSIRDCGDDIVGKTLTCAATGKSYKLTPQEFGFYKRKEIPAPDTCFFARHRERFLRRNPRHLWKRPCMKCGMEMKTSFAPERPEIVYCETCYQKEVY